MRASLGLPWRANDAKGGGNGAGRKLQSVVALNFAVGSCLVDPCPLSSAVEGDGGVHAAGVCALRPCAGLSRSQSSLFDGRVECWLEMVSTNILGTAMMTRAALQVGGLTLHAGSLYTGEASCCVVLSSCSQQLCRCGLAGLGYCRAAHLKTRLSNFVCELAACQWCNTLLLLP